MHLIVDANVLLAAIIKDSLTRRLLLEPRLELYAPETLAEEVSKHVENDEEIKRKTKLSTQELKELFHTLISEITLIEKNEYEMHLENAFQIAPHKEDAPYLALAMFLKKPVWSNDNGLMKQNAVRIISTKELVKLLSN